MLLQTNHKASALYHASPGAVSATGGDPGRAPGPNNNNGNGNQTNALLLAQQSAYEAAMGQQQPGSRRTSIGERNGNRSHEDTQRGQMGHGGGSGNGSPNGMEGLGAADGQHGGGNRGPGLGGGDSSLYSLAENTIGGEEQ